MGTLGFDDRNIRWNTLDGIEHLHYSILAIDEPARIVDVIFKFAADARIVLHRHKVLNHTLVVQGEHRLYHANGEVKDIRPVGRYTVTPGGDEPHLEGGGEGQDTIVVFSIRAGDVEVLYELLDDNQNLIGTLTFQGLTELFKAQKTH
ncbi:MAG: regulator [Panacagrimonas sp.]